MTHLSIDTLLEQLSTAIEASDLTRAQALAEQIKQQLALAHSAYIEQEKQFKALLTQLQGLAPMGAPGAPSPSPLPTPVLKPKYSATRGDDTDDDMDVERGIPREWSGTRGDVSGGDLEEAGVEDVFAGGSYRSDDLEAAPKPVSNQRDVNLYPVWFGTNRQPDGQGGFNGARNKVVSYGRVDVVVPKGHRFGETGSSFWQKLKRLDFRDDRLRIETINALDQDGFFSQLQQAMADARADGDAPQALVFIHGFNVSFKEAAIRAAQIGFDLKIPGATAFFSWPSKGQVAAYPADEATIEASEAAISQFLLDFSARCGAEKIHLIAHSMGNRGLLRALQRIALNVEQRGSVKFGQIFLAAPDVDRDVFIDLARIFPHYAERTTLYASKGDKAVHASAALHGAPRAGYFEPYTLANEVDTIAVPDFDIDLLGHSYFAQAEALLHDMYSLIRQDQPPNKRQRIHRLENEAQELWYLQR